jgi:cyclopropane fatty-acyl-phospholipid synthase-like methyltransferase
MPFQSPDIGENVQFGKHHYRAFVGDTKTYDIFSYMQFTLMTLLGLRQEHTLLDIGCGSLRAGKLFLVYLLPDRYFGIEPEQWLVEEGIERELGRELADRKRPRFLFDRNFSCAAFGVAFDYIIAQSIFSHASQAQIRRCLSQARASMKDTSLFAASFVEGDDDYAGDAWVYPETIRYRATTIERLAADAGLACRRLDWFHIGGQIWFVFFVPGNEPQVDHLATLNQSFPLRQELSHYRQRSDRLERIETHAFYRLVARIRQLFRRR